MAKLFFIIAASLGFLGVAAGAFGAHALSSYFDKYPSYQSAYQTATQYHIYHALALLGVAWAVSQWPHPLLIWAGFLFFIGLILFSGSLYLIVLTNLRWLGPITPLGGTALLAGWLCLILGVWRG